MDKQMIRLLMMHKIVGFILAALIIADISMLLIRVDGVIYEVLLIYVCLIILGIGLIVRQKVKQGETWTGK